MKPETKETTVIEIEGVLVPGRWDSAGEVSEISLMAFDEAEFKVDAAAAKFHGLRDHLQKHVRVSGRTRGRRLVEVMSVEILDEEVPTSPSRRKNGREQ